MIDSDRISLNVLGDDKSRSINYRERHACSVCGSLALDLALDLPKLPITGIFFKAGLRSDAYSHDQALLVCRECGHAQLLRGLAPETVYNDTYFHRSSDSSIAREGNDAFATFIRSVVGERRFKLSLEIGANDLYLISKIRDLSEGVIAVDPIWKQEAPPEIHNVGVLGKFVEELVESDMPGRPDLVVSVQTFEHILDPMEQLSRLVDLAADGALIFLEVPGFDALLSNLRFDQVFHQHIQYFSLASMLRLIKRLDCSYVAHSINHRYWGGALGIAFVKSSKRQPSVQQRAITPTAQGVAARYQACRRHLYELVERLRALSVNEFFGFGAAQMVPTLAYHMGSDLGFLSAILDDDPRRDGLFYPGLAVSTRRVLEDQNLANAAVLITAVDSTRPILRRLISLNPQHIIVPFPWM